MKNKITKLLLIFPIILLGLQLLVQTPMPWFNGHDINIYLQSIITGFGVDLFIVLIYLCLPKEVE